MHYVFAFVQVPVMALPPPSGGMRERPVSGETRRRPASGEVRRTIPRPQSAHPRPKSATNPTPRPKSAKPKVMRPTSVSRRIPLPIFHVPILVPTCNTRCSPDLILNALNSVSRSVSLRNRQLCVTGQQVQERLHSGNGQLVRPLCEAGQVSRSLEQLEQ